VGRRTVITIILIHQRDTQQQQQQQQQHDNICVVYNILHTIYTSAFDCRWRFILTTVRPSVRRIPPRRDMLRHGGRRLGGPTQ
jgi:hypothetical protein